MTGNGGPAARRIGAAPSRAAARRIGAALALLFALSLHAAPALADGKLEIRANLDRTEMGLGQTAMLTYTVLAEGVDLPPVPTPAITGGRVERLGTSQGFSWVNGRVIRTLTIGYRIAADTVGDVSIPAVHISSGGVEAESTPLALHVGRTPPAPRGEAPELLARLTVDRNRAYWNENVTVRFTVYSRIQLDGAPVWDPPAAAGFWSEVLGPATTQRRTIDGVEYDATEVRVAYFPTRTGRLTIGPTRAHVRIVRRVASQEPWSMLGLPDTQIEEGVIETDRVVLDVLPLPSGAPSGFKGAVGSYTMEVRVDRANVRAGEPVTVITSIKGEGNIGSAGDPDVFASAPARSYAASPSTSLDRSGQRLRGERRREMTFVPEAPGRFSILPVRYSWFDPEGQRYRTQMSDSIRIAVFPSDTPGDSLRPAHVTGPVAALRSQPGARGDLTLEPPAASRAVALVSLFATVAAFVGRRVRAGLDRDPRRRRAAAVDALLSELGTVSAGAEDAAPAAIRIASIVRRGLGLRYDIDVEGHPADDALARAKAAGASEADLEETSKLFQALDQLAFAPPDARAGIIQSERDAAERFLKRAKESIV